MDFFATFAALITQIALITMNNTSFSYWPFWHSASERIAFLHKNSRPTRWV